MQRRMSTIREYKFFRSFSAKVDNWPIRKAEAIWRKMRERKIADNLYTVLTMHTITINVLVAFCTIFCPWHTKGPKPVAPQRS
uniref:Uncharacterized protein n=1 Tax=Phlebotomus papatasi TaxID=29031 RepID=A0A1B0D751_PHLPP